VLHISDDMIDAVVSPRQAQDILREAFMHYGQGDAAMKLSTLGAVIPGQQVVGAKVYTTIEGQFNFVILLFSARDGRPLATFDAGALTRLRTAACSVLAAQALAQPQARTLGLFGAGTQGREHAAQMAAAFGLEQILLHDPYAPSDTAPRLAERTGVPVRHARADDIASCADIIVTASRSQHPLFSGQHLRPGAFVAAIGSSLPTTRELDDQALARARAVVVEWKQQTLAEAGDLVQADPKVLANGKIVEMADVLAGKLHRQSADEIYVYKSVGVGLEDIALAGEAYRELALAKGWPPA
jgi:ornithine cyclodeaminase